MYRGRGAGEKGRSLSSAHPGQSPPTCSERRNRGTSWSRLCLFRTRPPVRQVRCGPSPRGVPALRRRSPQGGDSSRGAAVLAAPLKTAWPSGPGARAPFGLGPVHCAPCTVHYLLSHVVHCVLCLVPVGAVHGGPRTTVHCALCLVPRAPCIVPSVHLGAVAPCALSPVPHLVLLLRTVVLLLRAVVPRMCPVLSAAHCVPVGGGGGANRDGGGGDRLPGPTVQHKCCQTLLAALGLLPGKGGGSEKHTKRAVPPHWAMRALTTHQAQSRAPCAACTLLH